MESPEKSRYTVGAAAPEYGDPAGVKDIVERKGHAVGEAADMYGDLATAEEYGYVERG